jgi:Tat protein secretion system quality control protein TatD with DNase activity
VVRVAEAIAELRGTTIDEIDRATQSNHYRLFNP